MATDVTAAVERLGNPLKQQYKSGPRVYARNVWDLQAFGGKLYIGGGNSSNGGPAPNAGPLPIIAYDPATNKFDAEFKIADEQIDLYYVFDGHLYSPGHDPKEDWSLGNFYRKEDHGGWKKHRNLPNGIHNYAMAWHNNKLFAGLGTQKGGAVAVSNDKGATWTSYPASVGRIHGFLEVEGKIFSAGVFYTGDMSAIKGPDGKQLEFIPVFEFDGQDKFLPRKDLNWKALFPGVETPLIRVAKVVKPVSVGKQCVYIGAFCHNDHQFLPEGIFVASSFAADGTKVTRMTLPEGARVWDILVRDSVLFALLDQPAADGRLISVVASADLTTTQEVLRFKAATFARSFEFLNGDLYIGLGCEVANDKKWTQAELHEDTGEILRVTKEKFGK